MAALIQLAVETTAKAEVWPWLTPLIAILTLLLGGGGVAALYKARADAKQGVAQQETAEDDALSKRWQAIIETQSKVLIEPVVAELADLRLRFGKLEAEYGESRRKYWSAIAHIRSVDTWIDRHLPPDFETTAKPEPPAIIAVDI